MMRLWFSTPRNHCLRRLTTWSMFCLGLLAAIDDCSLYGQAGVTFSEPLVQRWEVGVEVRVEGGQALGLVASTPIPIDWPEQDVSVIREDVSKNVSRVTYRTLGGTVKQMIVTIPKLKPDETARAVLTLEIKKRYIEAPQERDSFVIPKRVPTRIRPYLLPSPFIESRHARIQALANQIGIEQQSDWDKAEAVFKWVRDNVEYKFDEEIKSCLTALDTHQGDCEELSSLFVAICRAKGIPARAVWIPGHTYPEFYLEDARGTGHWFPCQAAGSYAFGNMPEAKPILQKGDNFRVTGHRQPLRYVRPTLTARNATASPILNWILRPVDSSAEEN